MGPPPAACTATRSSKPHLDRDLRTVATFIQVYCNGRHRDRLRAAVHWRNADVRAVVGRRVHLCDECAKLLRHAIVMRTRCPLDPKPMCKRCPHPCYAPRYRARIRAVMRYAGPRLLLRGRLDYLLHLL